MSVGIQFKQATLSLQKLSTVNYFLQKLLTAFSELVLYKHQQLCQSLHLSVDWLYHQFLHPSCLDHSLYPLVWLLRFCPPHNCFLVQSQTQSKWNRENNNDSGKKNLLWEKIFLSLLIPHFCFEVMRNWYIFKGDNSLKFVLLPSEKGSTLKGKNLLPRGANSFLLE